MRLLLSLAACAVFLGCGPPPRAPGLGDDGQLVGPHAQSYSMPDDDDRAFALHLPSAYDATAPLPVVIVLHGGGGNKEGARRMTCQDGDENSDTCMHKLAEREGFIVVFPDGTPGPVFSTLRTWNAGGGRNGIQCVSGDACAQNVDDIAYFDRLLAELERVVLVDTARVYVTGLSNGAAMAHRLACERSGRIAAIAPVAGANQAQAVQGCASTRALGVLHIHGSDDECWSFDGGVNACLQDDGQAKVSVPDSMDAWAAQNGCTEAPVETALDDMADDDTRVVRVDYGGCLDDTETTLLRVDGGGHTWPSGSPLVENRVGAVSLDISANEEMWRFFERHAVP
jgi:polyhydroxybutyrate depolymerase